MIFLLNKNKKPLDPIHPATARKLLKYGQAVVHKRIPFTIRLKELTNLEPKKYTIKIDPGSKTTGVAIVSSNEVVHLAEIEHKANISKKLQDRRSFRSSRRSRKLRYRKPRFDNRTRDKGWLPPSLNARVDNIISQIKRYQKLIPITSASQELVRFDMQKMRNPEISGVKYQQGELQGYEVREYLLDKFGRKCFYCEAENIPLEIEHTHPKSRGGSDSVSNLTIACNKCNQEKGNFTPEEWLNKIKSRRSKRYLLIKKNIPKLKSALIKPLKDAAAVNAAKNKLKRELGSIFAQVETGSGAQTKMNRVKRNLPKTHYFDALSVGSDMPDWWNIKTSKALIIRAIGRGSRYRSGTNKFGFPTRYMPKTKYVSGFITGDLIKANVPKGKYKGVHIGFCSMRSSGYSDIRNIQGQRIVQGVHARHFNLIQAFNGYNYSNKCITF